jgi:DNA mismatch repair protein MutS2
MQLVYPENFEQKIGFDRIRQMLSANCLSQLGKEKVEELTFLNNFKEINFQTDLALEFLKILREYDTFLLIITMIFAIPLLK